MSKTIDVHYSRYNVTIRGRIYKSVGSWQKHAAYLTIFSGATTDEGVHGTAQSIDLNGVDVTDLTELIQFLETIRETLLPKETPDAQTP